MPLDACWPRTWSTWSISAIVPGLPTVASTLDVDLAQMTRALVDFRNPHGTTEGRALESYARLCAERALPLTLPAANLNDVPELHEYNECELRFRTIDQLQRHQNLDAARRQMLLDGLVNLQGRLPGGRLSSKLEMLRRGLAQDSFPTSHCSPEVNGITFLAYAQPVLNNPVGRVVRSRFVSRGTPIFEPDVTGKAHRSWRNHTSPGPISHQRNESAHDRAVASDIPRRHK
ncbi:hypothetical protein BC940DRAFT_328797 [Gongronella butleri]|nr:hypothetical protein BC940DRAFT_328797 [Gongronella butleri]